MSRFDPAPSTGGVALTAAFAAVGAAATTVSAPAAALALVGAATMPAAVYRGDRRVHAVGAAVLFAGVLVAGLGGAAPAATLVATAATVVAWDVGENAVGVGAQLGREAPTWRIELGHAAASTVVAVGVCALAYGVFAVGVAGASTGGVLLLALAALGFALLFSG